MKPLGVVCGSNLNERVTAAAAVAAEFAEEVDREGRFPSEALAALRAQQLLNIAVPVELGGEGLGFVDIVDICQALGAVCASAGMVYAMHQISLAGLIDCASESAWHRAYIRRAAREQLLFASATSEAGVGGDLRQSRCAIEIEGDRFRLEKDASVISYGDQADALFITARRSPDAPASDQVLAVACRGQFVAERRSTWDTLGMRGTCSHGFHLSVDAPVEQIMPTPFADIAAESMVSISHLLWSAVWTGIAGDALSRAQAFVTVDARNHPGVAPAGAVRLASAFNQLVANEASIADVAGACDSFRSDPARAPTLGFALSLNALKVNVSTAALAVVEDCMMICGLEAYRNGTPYSMGRHLRDIHSARLMIGNDRILANTGQMMLLRRPSFGARA